MFYCLLLLIKISAFGIILHNSINLINYLAIAKNTGTYTTQH